jgi:hypothetical protein
MAPRFLAPQPRPPRPFRCVGPDNSEPSGSHDHHHHNRAPVPRLTPAAIDLVTAVGARSVRAPTMERSSATRPGPPGLSTLGAGPVSQARRSASEARTSWQRSTSLLHRRRQGSRAKTAAPIAPTRSRTPGPAEAEPMRRLMLRESRRARGVLRGFCNRQTASSQLARRPVSSGG